MCNLRNDLAERKFSLYSCNSGEAIPILSVLSTQEMVSSMNNGPSIEDILTQIIGLNNRQVNSQTSRYITALREILWEDLVNGVTHIVNGDGPGVQALLGLSTGTWGTELVIQAAKTLGNHILQGSPVYSTSNTTNSTQAEHYRYTEGGIPIDEEREPLVGTYEQSKYPYARGGRRRLAYLPGYHGRHIRG